MVELLIVIAIIALLMSLTFSVMYGLTTQAEEVATTTTVRKIDALLQQRMDAFNRALKGNRLDAAVSIVSVTLASQQIFGVREEVKEILAKKRSFRFEFPQRLDERLFEEHPPTGTAPKVAGLPDSLFKAFAEPEARQQLVNEGNATPTDQEVLDRATQNWQKHRPETESAELLYFALTAATSYGVGAVDTDRFTDEEVADTDEDGLPEFVDAWGQPLRFYRWPTRLIDRNPPVPFTPVLADPADATDVRAIPMVDRDRAGLLFRGLSPPPLPLPNGVLPRDLLLTDPDDPVGRLYSELERLDGTNGKPLFASEFDEAKYHTPETYHAPLVVSAGADGKLGLLEPNDTGRFGNLAQFDGNDDALTDNITNRNRRVGGRR
jgi:type II secretory pathway pseudopilin PulG